MNLWEKKLYFVFDELMGKIYIGKKNNSMKYIGKKTIKVSEPNR
jgi:hypothetical protein